MVRESECCALPHNVEKSKKEKRMAILIEGFFPKKRKFIAMGQVFIGPGRGSLKRKNISKEKNKKLPPIFVFLKVGGNF